MFKLIFLLAVFVFPILIVPSYGICFSDSKCLYTNENGIVSPKKQIQNGVYPDKILCKDSNHVTMMKFDSVVCIKPKSVQKLQALGWVFLASSIKHTEKDDVLIFTNKDEYKAGEPVTITMLNLSDITLKARTSLAGFVVYTQNDERVRSWWSSNLAVGRFNPNDERTEIWDQTSSANGPPMGGKYLSPEEHGGQVGYGVYVVKANHFLPDQLDHIPTCSFRIVE